MSFNRKKFPFPENFSNLNKIKIPSKNSTKKKSQNYLNSQLEKAIEKKTFEKAKRYIEEGANVNLKLDHDWTLVHEVVCNNNLNMLDFLIKCNVNVNVQADNGWTPLMYAVQDYLVDIVRILLHNNADINIKDTQGLSAYTLSARLYKLNFKPESQIIFELISLKNFQNYSQEPNEKIIDTKYPLHNY